MTLFSFLLTALGSVTLAVLVFLALVFVGYAYFMCVFRLADRHSH